jgi:adenylate cyclase class 2
MRHLNIEIKASCINADKLRRILQNRNAEFKGIDHQTDTYFQVPHGRLKLREGNIENSLIHYDRPDQLQPKDAHVSLYHCQPDAALKATLTEALGILVEVKKKREIYFIGNIKFHIDEVEGLGSFVEIEAIDIDGSIGRDRLLGQCREYMSLFGITETDLIGCSYSDMLLDPRKFHARP